MGGKFNSIFTSLLNHLGEEKVGREENVARGGGEVEEGGEVGLALLLRHAPEERQVHVAEDGLAEGKEVDAPVRRHRADDEVMRGDVRAELRRREKGLLNGTCRRDRLGVGVRVPCVETLSNQVATRLVRGRPVHSMLSSFP